MQLDLGLNLGIYNSSSSAPVNWTPAELPNLALWLDAEDTASITLNGSNVSQWSDKSGNGRHATQATAANQPTYLATGFNGKPTLQNSLTSALELGTTSLGRNVGGITCAIVGSHAAGVGFNQNGNEIFVSNGIPPGSSTRFAMTPNSSVSTAVKFAITGRRLDGDAFDGESSSTDSLAKRGLPWIRIAERNYSDGLVNHWTDGTQDLTDGTVGTQGAGNTSDTDSVRTSLFIGATAVSIGTKLSEIVLTHSTLTTTDRQKLEGYLAWKWGLEANLPADHPYKLTPPTV